MTHRNERSLDIIPLERISQMTAMIVGCGAIGSQVAKMLAHTGIGHIILVDHDRVSTENMGSQGFREKDLGRRKVNAISDQCGDINMQTDVTVVPSKFHTTHPATVVFSCVDKMSVRDAIFVDALANNVAFFVDGRMNALSMRILTDEPINYNKPLFDYRATIFPDGEMMQGSCTARATIYTASIAAGLMVNQFVMWLNHAVYPHDFTFSLTALEIGEPTDEQPGQETQHNLQDMQLPGDEHERPPGSLRQVPDMPPSNQRPAHANPNDADIEAYFEKEAQEEAQDRQNEQAPIEGEENHTPQDWPYDHPAGHRGL